MKTILTSILALSLISPFAARAAEEQISSSRLKALACTATNAWGVSQFSLSGGSVDSVTNGFLQKSYRVSNLGNSAQYGFGFVNLSNAGDIVSFLFPGQAIDSGQQTLNGVLFLNKASSPFQPQIGMGTPWASVSCSVGITR